MVAHCVKIDLRLDVFYLMFVYSKMPEKCACGQKCDHGKPGACTHRRTLPARFTKKGKSKPKGGHVPRVYKKKLY
jgi:hypothetical protein